MIKDFEGILVENKVLIDDSTFKGWLVEKGFGENKGRGIIIDLYEGLYLTAKGKIKIKQKGKIVNGKQLLELGLEYEKDFYSKALVFSDLRENGYCVKTGLKFGFDYRVYPKGKKMGQAHSQFGINVLAENEKISMTQISRITRLAGNIHIKAIIAIVDREDSINYYQMERKLF
jgi:tRNA-intron endonuclease, archaea type